MNTLPYELLLRWKDDGGFSGGHTIRRDPVTGALSPALPIGKDSAFPWPAIASEVNAALGDGLAAKDTELSAMKTELAALQKSYDELSAKLTSGVATIRAIIADPETPTEVGIAAFLVEATKDETQKQLDAAIAERDAAQAKIDDLSALANLGATP